MSHARTNDQNTVQLAGGSPNARETVEKGAQMVLDAVSGASANRVVLDTVVPLAQIEGGETQAYKYLICLGSKKVAHMVAQSRKIYRRPNRTTDTASYTASWRKWRELCWQIVPSSTRLCSSTF